MQIFVYELITGGGLLADLEVPSGSLLREGSAMVAALAADFAQLAGVQVAMSWDARLEPPRLPGCDVYRVADAPAADKVFRSLAGESDWTVLIAPELDGILLETARKALAAGGRLLSPGLECIGLASDKTGLLEHLQHRGIDVPSGRLIRPGEPVHSASRSLPAVLKPNDGAGSEGVMLLDAGAPLPARRLSGYRLEEYLPGHAVSVGAICRFTEPPCLLPPARQHLSGDGRFRHQGGSLPLEEALSQRASKIAAAVTAALPPSLGYLGIDMVLGERDVVIEVNPRLTTSYVGLRHLVSQNLAAAMLAAADALPAAGGWPPDLVQRARRVEFTPGGQCEITESRELPQ